MASPPTPRSDGLAGQLARIVIEIGGAPPIGEDPSPDAPATKLEAEYRPQETKGERCGTCTHFRANRCELVVGTIDSAYVCDWWEPGQPKRKDAQPSPQRGRPANKSTPD